MPEDVLTPGELEMLIDGLGDEVSVSGAGARRSEPVD